VEDIANLPKALVDLLTVLLNGVTLAALYFIVASGFTLIFGLMRTTNMAHGSLYMLGAYIGVSVTDATGDWLTGVVAGFAGVAAVGIVIHLGLLARMAGQDLRQALVTIGLSIIIADLLLAYYGGVTYQIPPPDVATGTASLPFVVGGGYASYRLFMILAAGLVGGALWLILNRTRLGMYIRAGIDDRDMLSALGVNVSRVFLVVFALGAGLAGLSGVIGATALSISPSEDGRYLLSSLVVVIVGGMGSLGGAAIGALIIGLSEQIGLFYAPTYSIFITFVIMAAVLAVRPQGLMGRPA
jgi:branched-chain amino acid transport system permease protein